MSSPYTIGFPAMTAWLGAIHALQRSIQKKGLENVKLTSVAVSCHNFDLQTFKGPRDFVHSIIGTSNPLDKDGGRPAFIEEARCHLEVSLLVEYQGLTDSSETKKLEELTNSQLPLMKFAGGDILSVKLTESVSVDEEDEKEVKEVLRKLMLGYVLIERRDLMISSMKEGKDALDSLLDHLKVMHRSTKDEEKVSWTSSRKTDGWIVPIATGFQGISDIGIAKNQRDSSTLHRFAESVVTLGEFVMPYRVKDLDQILWKYHVEPEQNLYLCQSLLTLNNNQND